MRRADRSTPKVARVAPATLLDRHARGDWGAIDPEDQGLNEQALVTGARLLASITCRMAPWSG
jgi:hypothetical protein